MATTALQEHLNANPGWKAFMDLRKQAQRGAAAGMSEAEIEAEIAAYRSGKQFLLCEKKLDIVDTTLRTTFMNNPLRQGQ